MSKQGYRPAAVPVTAAYGDRGKSLMAVNVLGGGIGGAIGTEVSGAGYDLTPNPVAQPWCRSEVGRRPHDRVGSRRRTPGWPSRRAEAMDAAAKATGQAGPDHLDGPAAATAAADVPDGSDKTVATVLGEIVWLMSQSAEHKHVTVGDLEWMVMPAILLRQFRLFYKEGQPVAAVLFARASDEVAARVAAGEARLAPAEWRSGERETIVCRISQLRQP